MRRLVVLSLALGAFLLVLLNVQRAIYETLTNRPFLGTWTPGSGPLHHGGLTRIEFARGGRLWITTFGQNRWSAHWEEGRWNQLIIAGLDPARPKAKEAFHWFKSRDGLSISPTWRPGLLRPNSHPNSGYNFDFHYSRVSDKTWPTPERLVGSWVTRLGPYRYRTRDGQVRRLPGARMLLDVRPGGELCIYREGLPCRHGRWAANGDGRGFSTAFACVEEDPNHPGNGAIWTGGMSAPPGVQPYLNLNLWGRQQDRGVSPQPRMPEDFLGSLSRVPDGPADRKPFIGAWRTRAQTTGRRLQLEILPGGVFWITEAGRPHQRGAWREEGPWPRLIVRGMDAAVPERETEWLWSHGDYHSGWATGRGGERKRFEIPERLSLVDVSSPTVPPADRSFLELVRDQSASKTIQKTIVAR